MILFGSQTTFYCSIAKCINTYHIYKFTEECEVIKNVSIETYRFLCVEGPTVNRNEGLCTQPIILILIIIQNFSSFYFEYYSRF